MKIAYISSTSSGMHEHSIYYDLLNQLKEFGHDVTIIYAREKRTRLNTSLYFNNGIRYFGIKTGNLTKNSNLLDKAWSTIRFDRIFRNSIRNQFSDEKFDLVLFSTPPVTFVKTLKFFKEQNSFIYLMLKDIFPQNAVDMGMFSKSGLIYKFFRKKEKRIYAQSDYIGAMSAKNVDFIIKNNPNVINKIEILPNSLKINDVDLFYSREHFSISEEDTVLLYGGNLGIPQGIDFITECMDKIEGVHNIKMIICGSGSEVDKIKSKIRVENLKNTLYLGQISSSEYRSLAKVSDIGLVFLDYSFSIPNYPQRILGYMEAGLPIVCATDPNTDVGTEAEQNGYGYRVLSNDSDTWFERIMFLSKNKNMAIQMGDRGRQYLRTNFNVEKAANIILKHIKE